MPLPMSSRPGKNRWQTKGRFCLQTLLGLLALLVAAGVPMGCADKVQRYKVLAFFFDGVPHPDGTPARVPQYARNGRYDAGVREQVRETAATTQPAKVLAIDYLYHEPYKKRQCQNCHDQQQSNQLDAAPGVTCRRCHETYFQTVADDWMHGPTVLGQCNYCHEPHKSEHRALLTSVQPDLCLTCHDASFMKNDPVHADLPSKDCSTCHDPHAAGNRLLLADSRTYQRRKSTQAPVPSKHAAWSKDDCQRCHQADKSNQLVAGVNEVCVTCHTQVRHPQGPTDKLHQAVLDGKCTNCHTPHRATRPHLIRADAEKVCYSCHKPEEIAKAPHPPVVRADCLLCHSGHRSPADHLLQPKVAAVFAARELDDEPDAGPALLPGVVRPPVAEPGPAASQPAHSAAPADNAGAPAAGPAASADDPYNQGQIDLTAFASQAVGAADPAPESGRNRP